MSSWVTRTPNRTTQLARRIPAKRRTSEQRPPSKFNPAGLAPRLRLAKIAPVASPILKPRRNQANFALETELDSLRKPSSFSFTQIGVRDYVVDALRDGLKVEIPTDIQRLAIPAIMKSDDVLIAAETGGGKTLAYLAPLMQKLKDQELDTDDLTTRLSAIRKPLNPRAVIVLPTRELVMQVSSVAKALSHFIRLRVVGIDSSLSRSDILKAFGDSPVDLLITSSGSLIKMMGMDKHGKIIKRNEVDFDARKKLIRNKSIRLSLSKCTSFVVDEADTMFDEGFGDELKILLDGIIKRRCAEQDITSTPVSLDSISINPPAASISCQFVFVTATLPASLSAYFKKHFPSLNRITTRHLHNTSMRLKQAFLKLSGSNTKESMLVDIIRRGFIAGNKKMLVFCNTRVAVEKIGHLLQEKGFNALTLLAGEEKKDRKLKVALFVGPVEGGSDPNAQASNILVSTDLASRGLDTVEVDHVICYDFPSTAIDYLHRVGRTARNGAVGQATSIIASRNIALSQSIEKAVRTQQKLA